VNIELDIGCGRSTASIKMYKALLRGSVAIKIISWISSIYLNLSPRVPRTTNGIAFLYFGAIMVMLV